jgi:hypothetical protein
MAEPDFSGPTVAAAEVERYLDMYREMMAAEPTDPQILAATIAYRGLDLKSNEAQDLIKWIVQGDHQAARRALLGTLGFLDYEAAVRAIGVDLTWADEARQVAERLWNQVPYDQAVRNTKFDPSSSVGKQGREDLAVQRDRKVALLMRRR